MLGHFSTFLILVWVSCRNTFTLRALWCDAFVECHDDTCECKKRPIEEKISITKGETDLRNGLP